MELLVCISLLIYSHLVDELFNYQLVNTTSTSIGVIGSHEVVEGSDSKKLYGQTASIQAVFSPAYHKM